MSRRTFAAPLAIAATAAIVATAAACIDVPDSMRVQFAPAGPSERTNYRPGIHGIAPAPVAPQQPDAATPSELDAGPANVAEGGAV